MKAFSRSNALVLGLLARRLPKFLQGKALTYGLVGAIVFRIIAIATAAFLLHWRIVKLLGGAYLVYVAAKYFFFGESSSPANEKIVADDSGNPVRVDAETNKPVTAPTNDHGIDFKHAASTHSRAFWMTVVVIELTDIAFAIDSILAAIALVGSPPPGTPKGSLHPKLWVVITGGMLGVILMRFAAVIFIKLLETFPRFETSAYLLVAIIGAKLVADWGLNSPETPHRIDFHSPGEWGFWVFWSLMLVSFLIGFIPQKKKA